MASSKAHDEQLAAIAKDLNARLPAIAPFVKGAAVLHLEDRTTEPKPPAPAWYIPSTGNMYLHLDKAKLSRGALAKGHMHTPSKEMSRALGLIVHEAAHSVRSDWLDEAHRDRSLRPYMQTLTLFEELRIERFAVDHKHAVHIRPSLRASFDLILGSGHAPATTSRTAAAYNWALMAGRVYAGVVDTAEVEEVDNAARTLLGDETVDQLEDILQEVLVTECEVAPLAELARRWKEVVNDPVPEDLIIVVCGIHTDEPGDGGGGSTDSSDEDAEDAEIGDGGGASDEDGEEDDDADTTAAEDTTAAAEYDPDHIEHGESAPTESTVFHPEDGKILDDAMKNATSDIVKEWKPGGVQLANASELAKQVFGGDAKSRSKSWKELTPSPKNRQDVVRMARVLETLSIPAITKTKAGSALPPGRFRSREAIRASADRAAGRMTEATPWTKTKRQHSHIRPIVVGIATDTSGSMAWAETAVAEYAYIMSNAGLRIGARTAAVTFGDQAEAVTKPRQVATKIRIRAADGGSEAFDHGIAALDGVLNLTTKDNAAKLLLIVSDGMLVKYGEPERARMWMAKCHEAGVAVVWLTIGSTGTISGLAPKAETMSLSGIAHYRGGETGKIVDQMLEATKIALEKLEA